MEIVLGLALGVLSAVVAFRKRLDPVVWFLGGRGVGLLTLLAMPAPAGAEADGTNDATDRRRGNAVGLVFAGVHVIAGALALARG